MSPLLNCGIQLVIGEVVRIWRKAKFVDIFFHMVPLDGGRWPNKTPQRSNTWYLVVNDRNMHQDTGKYLSRIKMQFPLMKCVKSLCSEWQMERAGHKSQLVMTYAVIDRNYLTFLYCFFFSHSKWSGVPCMAF